MHFPHQIEIFPHPLPLSTTHHLLHTQRLIGTLNSFVIVIVIVHIILSKDSIHLDIDWMLETQPLLTMIGYKIDRFAHQLRFVLDVPLDLSQMTLINESWWKRYLIKCRIELRILIWCDEVEEILTYLIIQWMVFQHEEIWRAMAGLSSDQPT